MPSGKEIKARIKSVKNTGKITRAMELISTVKMKKAQDAVMRARPFALTAARIFAQISQDPTEIILAPVEGAKQRMLIVLIAADKGLCGGYNVNIFRVLARFLRTNDVNALDFVVVGKRAREFALRSGCTIVADFSSDIALNESKGSKKLARFVLDRFQKGECNRIDAIYSRYVSALTQEPRQQQILPFDAHALHDLIGASSMPVSDESVQYKIEPDRQTLIASALTLILDLNWREIILEARASEHSARMVAMKGAKDAAAKRASAYTLLYNKARQAAITKEISELVGGAEAMKDS